MNTASIKDWAHWILQAPAPSRDIVRRLVFERHPEVSSVERKKLVDAIMRNIAVEIDRKFIPDAEITAENLHRIPHEPGNQRCQAVAGNGEGQVPTTALPTTPPSGEEYASPDMVERYLRNVNVDGNRQGNESSVSDWRER